MYNMLKLKNLIFEDISLKEEEKPAATPEEFETILTNVLEDLTIRIDGLEIGAPLQRNINEWTASLLYKSDLMIDLFWTLIDPMKGRVSVQIIPDSKDQELKQKINNRLYFATLDIPKSTSLETDVFKTTYQAVAKNIRIFNTFLREELPLEVDMENNYEEAFKKNGIIIQEPMVFVHPSQIKTKFSVYVDYKQLKDVEVYGDLNLGVPSIEVFIRLPNVGNFTVLRTTYLSEFEYDMKQVMDFVADKLKEELESLM